MQLSLLIGQSIISKNSLHDYLWRSVSKASFHHHFNSIDPALSHRYASPSRLLVFRCLTHLARALPPSEPDPSTASPDHSGAASAASAARPVTEAFHRQGTVSGTLSNVLLQLCAYPASMVFTKLSEAKFRFFQRLCKPLPKIFNHLDQHRNASQPFNNFQSVREQTSTISESIGSTKSFSSVFVIDPENKYDDDDSPSDPFQSVSDAAAHPASDSSNHFSGSNLPPSPDKFRVPTVIRDLPLPEQYASDMLRARRPDRPCAPTFTEAPERTVYSNVTMATPKSRVPAFYQPVILRGPNGEAFRCLAFVDTGAEFSHISPALVRTLGCSTRQSTTEVVKTADSASSPSIFTSEHVSIWSKSIAVQHHFRVLNLPSETAPHILLGRELLEVFGISLIGLTADASDPNHHADSDHYFDLERQPHVFSTADDKLPPELEAERSVIREKLRDLLRVNEFLVPDNSFINYDNSEVRILHHPDTPPSFVRQYRNATKSHLDEHITKQVDDWVSSGKLVPWNNDVHGPWPRYNMPLLPVVTKNPDGSIRKVRVCVDARGINHNIINNESPLPDITHIYAKFTGKRFFTELDMSQCFLQFRVLPEHQHKLAVQWHGKTYVFAGAPFGLKHLSSHVQRIMTEIFADFPFVDIYIDNIIIASDTLDEHLAQVSAVIERCNAMNIRLSFTKSAEKLVCQSLKLLGSIISADGRRPDPDKIATVRDWPLPTSKSDLLSFLCLANYIRPHVRHFADLAAPLSAMTGSKSVLEWNDSTRSSFDLLRQAIASCPRLNNPDLTKPIALAVDSSITGIGACLFQPAVTGEQPTANNIISFSSRALHKYERNYSVYKLELNALVFGLRAFDDYLYGRHFTLYTDHHSLIFLNKQRDLNRNVRNWFTQIMEFDFDIFHVPGHINVVPDVLSRRYTSLWGVSPPMSFIPNLSSSPLLSVVSLISTIQKSPHLSVAALVSAAHHRLPSAPRAQLGSVRFNPIVSEIIYHSSGTPNAKYFEQNDIALLPDFSVSSDFVSSDSASASDLFDSPMPVFAPRPPSFVCFLNKLQPRTAPLNPLRMPKTEEAQIELIRKHHALKGHFGERNVYSSLVREGYHWPDMQSQIRRVIQSCRACMHWNSTKRIYHPLRPLKASLPWDSVGLDIITSFEPFGDKSCIMILTDVFTSFSILRALPDRSAKSVAGALHQIIGDVGPPRLIQSDGEGAFVSEVVQSLITDYGALQRAIPAYNPRSAGKVEAHVKIASITLRKLMHDCGTQDWPALLPFAQLCMNTKHKDLTNSSPFVLFYNRTANEFESYVNTDVPAPTAEHRAAWSERQQHLHELVFPAVRQVTNHHQHQYITRFNQQHNVTSQHLPTGALVMLHDVVRTTKNQPPWLGPYTIARVTPLGMYTLRDFAGGIYHRDVTRDQLKVVDSDDIKSDDLQTHYVDRILNHRNRGSKREYLIAWADCSTPTWEPAENLDDLQSLTSAYFANLKRLPRAPKQRAQQQSDSNSSSSDTNSSAPIISSASSSDLPPSKSSSSSSSTAYQQSNISSKRRRRAPAVPAVSSPEFSVSSSSSAHSHSSDALPTRRSRVPNSRLRDSVVFD